MTDGIQKKLRAGIATMLHNAGAATWTTGAINVAASPPPVVDQVLPDRPDLCAALSTYFFGGDEPTLAGSVLMLQVRTRSALNDVASGDDLDDAIGAQLLGHFPLVLPNGVTINTLVRKSGTPIGRDPAGRMERTTNYELVIHDPGPFRG